MMIVENLWQVGGAGRTASGDAGVFLIRDGDEAAVVDAGCGDRADLLIRNIERCIGEKRPVRYLFLTHCHYDHTGGAESLRDRFACETVAHELDAAFLRRGDSRTTAADWYGAKMNPVTIDHTVHGDGETFRLSDLLIEAIHCPGHSPGSMVLTVTMEGRRVLFGQDVHGPLHPSLRSDRKAYQRSLRRMLALEADILCEGHFGVIEGREAVAAFIRSYLDPAGG